jgi:hypothetical protein
MKAILAAIIGLSAVAVPAAQAEHRRYHRHHHHYDSDRVTRVVVTRPPWEVRRHWHRGHSYTWNNHRYRWDGGTWAVYLPGRVVVYR